MCQRCKAIKDRNPLSCKDPNHLKPLHVNICKDDQVEPVDPEEAHAPKIKEDQDQRVGKEEQDF